MTDGNHHVNGWGGAVSTIENFDVYIIIEFEVENRFDINGSLAD